MLDKYAHHTRTETALEWLRKADNLVQNSSLLHQNPGDEHTEACSVGGQDPYGLDGLLGKIDILKYENDAADKAAVSNAQKRHSEAVRLALEESMQPGGQNWTGRWKDTQGVKRGSGTSDEGSANSHGAKSGGGRRNWVQVTDMSRDSTFGIGIKTPDSSEDGQDDDPRSGTENSGRMNTRN